MATIRIADEHAIEFYELSPGDILIRETGHVDKGHKSVLAGRDRREGETAADIYRSLVPNVAVPEGLVAAVNRAAELDDAVPRGGTREPSEVAVSVPPTQLDHVAPDGAGTAPGTKPMHHVVEWTPWEWYIDGVTFIVGACQAPNLTSCVINRFQSVVVEHQHETVATVGLNASFHTGAVHDVAYTYCNWFTGCDNWTIDGSFDLLPRHWTYMARQRGSTTFSGEPWWSAALWLPDGIDERGDFAMAW